jgi:hypothetical protein
VLIVAVGSVTDAARGFTLQDRVDALAQQVSLRYANQPERRLEVRSQIAAALGSWNGVATPSTDDQRRFDDWLSAALDAQMPGGDGRVPTPPTFAPEPAMRSVVAPNEANRHSADGGRPAPRVAEPTPRDLTPLPTPSATRLSIGPPFPTSGIVQPNPAATGDPAGDGAEAPATPARSKWSKHPSAAPLEWPDPFGDTPEPADGGGPTSSAETPQETFDSARVSVNLIELRAVVRAYNDTLRGLNRRAASIGAGDLPAATALVAELEALDREREFLDLYRGGLTKAQAESLPRNPTTALAWELVRRSAVSNESAGTGPGAAAWRSLRQRVESQASQSSSRGIAGA